MEYLRKPVAGSRSGSDSMPLIHTLPLPGLLYLLFLALAALTNVGMITALHADQNDPQLGVLFSLLQEPATTESEAAEVTSQIWQKWLESDNEDVDKLMTLGIHAMNRLALPEAVIIFSKVIELAPDFAEGWNKRATVYYMMREFQLSTADVKNTLKLEPRHFGALSGQGMIYVQTDNNHAAIEFFKRALEVNPSMSALRENIEYLEQELKKNVI